MLRTFIKRSLFRYRRMSSGGSQLLLLQGRLLQSRHLDLHLVLLQVGNRRRQRVRQSAAN